MGCAVKLAYFFEYPTVSGAEGSGLELLAHLDRREFQVTAFAPPGGELAARLAALSIPHELWRAPRGAEERRACSEALARGRFDLLHANTLHLGRFTGAVAPTLGLPAVTHIREFGTLSAQVRTHLCANARLIAVSHALCDDLVSQGIPAEKLRVIHNGVSAYAPPIDNDIRRELTLAADTPLVAWLGQITVRKAPDVFLAAATDLAGRDARVHFLLCGAVFGRKEENVRLEAQLRAAAACPPLAGRLHLLGWRRDARAVLAQATVLVHTARQEPLGRVLIEALAAGTPVVATRVGGTPEVLGPCGVLVEANDTAACAHALTELLANEEKRAALRREGRARWEALFAPARMLATVCALWREVASRTT